MMQSVTKIVQNMALEGQIPVKELAQRINKPYATLLRELNPYDSGAKLGVETLVDILRVTRNPEPLRYMAEELGLVVVPRMPPAEADIYSGVLRHD